jgi:hypothetical protein
MLRFLAVVSVAVALGGGLARLSSPRADIGDAIAPAADSSVESAPAADRTAPAAPAPTTANAEADAEPTKEDCDAALDKVRALTNTLPTEHPSRYFAERYMQQSMVEAGNGEFDDCLHWAERATEEVRELRHSSKSGESIEVMQPGETPARPPSRETAKKKSAHEKERR